MYMSYEMDMPYLMYYALIPLIILASLFTFHGQIDFWWSERNPVTLDPPIQFWLSKYDTYYQKLNEEQAKKYENRLVLYMEGRAFQSVGREMHDVPYDIQAIVASSGIKMMMGLDDYLIGDMDRIYLYKHPFPSPRFKFLHTVETDTVDGTFIFSLEHLIPGLIQPDLHYNIAMHGYVDAFIDLNKDIDFHFLNDVSWESLESICPIRREKVLKTIGFNDVYKITVIINHYFTFSDKFKQVLPDEYDKLNIIFNRDT